jgi:GGDEF domain-containing protein
VIAPEVAARYRDELLSVLQEDAHNEQRILRRLDQIRAEEGISAYAALLLVLTGMAFDETEARRHWEAILAHRRTLQGQLQRDVALRVAALDHFLNVNQTLTGPRLIDIAMSERQEPGSSVDRVTGLPNAAAFLAALQAETRRGRRYELGLSVLYLDLDDFREMNERLGELVGGILLREVAILIQNKIRDIDVAARLAGEEFGILLPETERMGAFLVAERKSSGMVCGAPWTEGRSACAPASESPAIRRTPRPPTSSWSAPRRRCTSPSRAAATPSASTTASGASSFVSICSVGR